MASIAPEGKVFDADTGKIVPLHADQPNELLEAALEYARRGWYVLPVKPDGTTRPDGRPDKGPLTKLVPNGKTDATTDPATIRKWWRQEPNANIGVNLAASGLVAADVDSYKLDCAWHELVQGREIPATLEQSTPSGGRHYIFKAQPGVNHHNTKPAGLEIIHDGYVLLEPSRAGGKPYRIECDDDPAPAPDWLPRRPDKPAKPGNASDLTFEVLEDVWDCLAAIPNDRLDWDFFANVAGAVYNATGGDDIGRVAFEAWCRKCPDNNPAETAKKWREAAQSPFTEIGARWLIGEAKKHNPTFERRSRERAQKHGEQAAKALTGGEQRVRSGTAADLKDKVFPPLKFVVPQYVPEGLFLFAGRPKLGKSWMVLDWCLAVAWGGTAMNSVRCEQGAVLYCALEDNERRLQDRLGRIIPDPRTPWPQAFEYWTDMARLDQGGEDQIREWIDKADNPRLVVVDTLAKVERPRGKGEDAYASKHAALKGLHRIASDTGVAIVAVTHVTKSEYASGDPFERITGSLGGIGTADTGGVLDRDASGKCTFYVRGRDIEEVESAVQFSKASCLWSVLGDASQVVQGEERQAIIDALQDGESGPRKIAQDAGLKEASVRHLLRKMVEGGQVEKAGYGKYRLPNHTVHTVHTSAETQAQRGSQSVNSSDAPVHTVHTPPWRKASVNSVNGVNGVNSVNSVNGCADAQDSDVAEEDDSPFANAPWRHKRRTPGRRNNLTPA
jgi:hypothetical protein